MKKHVVAMLALAVALTLSLVTASGALQRDVSTCLRSTASVPGCEPDRLQFKAGASVKPKTLPKHDLAPVGLEIHGKISSENGGHPQALRKATANVGEGVAIDAVGLPACPLRKLEGRGVSAARQACRDAIVGSGVAHMGLASSESTVRAPLTLFNGGASGGVTRLYVHSSIAVPRAVPLVGVVKIRSRGPGLETTWKLPPILEGDGALLDFRFSVRRHFMASGEKQSYVRASCSDGDFQVNLPKIVFRNEAHTPGESSQTLLKGSLSIPCTARP